MVHGQTVTSYNDGSYFIATRSTRRPSEWVKRDYYPRASLEVKKCLQYINDSAGLMIPVQCKRKVHSRELLILAQELGEILAIGHNRHVNNAWLEKDREVTCFYSIINKNRFISLGFIMTGYM